MKRNTGMVAVAAGAGLIALVLGLYFGMTMRSTTQPLHPTQGLQMLQTERSFTQDNRTYDQAVIPMVANQPYRFDHVIFTYLGNTTANAGQCPPANLKPFNELYSGNEIKHFKAVLMNGTSVNLDTCWPLPHTPIVIPPSQTGHGVSTGLQKRWEWRWFDPDSETAGIMQDQIYFVPGNTTFYYFVEQTGQ